MKNLNLFILSFVVLGIWSCSDFLESEPLTAKNTTTYYANYNEAFEALVGCYDGLQYIYGDKGIPMITDVMADLSFSGLGNGDAENFRMFDEFDKNVEPSLLNEFEGAWEYYYMTLNRCNMLISRIDQVDWDGAEAQAGIIEGEARFIRAYCYLDMVRMWERVPLLTEPTTENVPQADPDDTYAQIVEDLKFAIDNCTDVTYPEIASTDYGHATKWAAEALLARAYLFYTGYYGTSDLVGQVSEADALAYVEDIIANSGHALVDDFYALWPAAAQYKAVTAGGSLSSAVYAGENNEEVVFGIKYTYLSDYNGNLDGNHWLVLNGIRLQSFGEYGYGYGWGANTVLPEVYDSWDDTDDRKAASVLAVEEEGLSYNQIKDMREYTGYFTKKYVPLADSTGTHTTAPYTDGNFMISQYQDFFAIRYADVLLMAAELGSADALTYLNLVHERSCPDALTEVSKDVIFEERKWEFAFEGIRFWDLLRYDNTLQYAADAVSYTGTVLNGGVEVTKTIDGENLKTTRGLFQIPNNQITLSNGVLTQNEGW